MQNFKNNRGTYLFWGIIVIYALLLLYIARVMNISEDETYTLNTTSRNIAGVINQAYNFEFQLPAYFVLVSFWRLMGSGIFFAKLSSIISIAIAALYIYKLSNLIFNDKKNYWIVIIFLLNPFTVWAALELRLYAFSIMLSVLIIFNFYKYVFNVEKKYLYFLLGLGLVGIYTQYFFVFLLIVLALITLYSKGWRYFFKFCLYLIPLALLFLPNFIFLPNQINEVKSHGKGLNLSKIISVLRSPQNLGLGINYLPDAWINRVVRIIFIFLFIIAYYILFRSQSNRKNLSYKNFNVVILSIILLTIFFCISIYISDIVFDSKYMVVTFPFIILSFTVFKIFSPLIRNLVFGCISLYFSTILVSFYRHPVNTYDFVSLGKYIEKIEQPGEPILLYRPNLALPFHYYYNGKNSIIPLPAPVNFNSNYLTNIKDTNEFKNLLDGIKPIPHSYILISDTTKFETTLNMNREMINNYIYKNYKVKIDTFFKGWAKDKTFRIISFEKNK